MDTVVILVDGVLWPRVRNTPLYSLRSTLLTAVSIRIIRVSVQTLATRGRFDFDGNVRLEVQSCSRFARLDALYGQVRASPPQSGTSSTLVLLEMPGSL